MPERAADQKRATKLVIRLKNKSYTDRLIYFILPTIKYRHLQGDMHGVKWRHKSLWSRYDSHFVGIARHNARSKKAKIYRVIQIKLNQLV